MDNKNTGQQLLKDPDVYPSNEVLFLALGESSSAYTMLARKLQDFCIETEWRYYNDGKAWLAKGVCKKKTVFWLSVWEGFFKVSLFFTEKTRAGIQELPISGSIKASIANEPPRGKLIPLIIDVHSEEPLEDVYALIAYKQNIK